MILVGLDYDGETKVFANHAADPIFQLLVCRLGIEVPQVYFTKSRRFRIYGVIAFDGAMTLPSAVEAKIHRIRALFRAVFDVVSSFSTTKTLDDARRLRVAVRTIGFFVSHLSARVTRHG